MARKKGKRRILVTTKSGKTVRLLTPAQKGGKFAFEMRNGVKVTNFGGAKRNRNGKLRRLTKTERAYRAGYLDARKDNAKAYVHNKAKRAARRAARNG